MDQVPLHLIREILRFKNWDFDSKTGIVDFFFTRCTLMKKHCKTAIFSRQKFSVENDYFHCIKYFQIQNPDFH